MTASPRAASAAADWPALLLIALTAIAGTLMLLWKGASCGHDFDFHLLSWMEVARDWRLALLYPHWIASANYGAGEPRLVFYPPGSWLLGAALGSLLGWVTAPVAYTWACLLAGGLTAYRLAREWLGKGAAACSAACLYIANPYTLFVVYERTAYGELLASAILPWVLLFATRARPPVFGMAAAFAAVWVCNAPAGVIASYALLWLALVRLTTEGSWQPALRMGGAVALGLGLDGFYLVPASYEQRWVEIARAAAAPGMRVRDSFLFGHTGEPYHDQVLRTASWLAVILLATAAVSYVTMAKGARKRLLAPATLLPVTLFLLLPVSEPVWRYAPHLRFLQFPWRWLMIVSVLAAVFLAGVASRLRSRHWRTILASILVLAVALLSTALSAWKFYQPCEEEDTVAAQLAVFRSGAGVEGTDEYTPAGADNGAIPRNLPRVRLLREADAESADSSREQNPPWRPEGGAQLPATVTIQTWQPEHQRICIETGEAGYAVLRLMDYPAWSVAVNGRMGGTRPRRDDGLLTIPIAAGQSTIDISWSATPDVRYGRLLSLASLMVFTGFLLWRCFSEKRSLPPEQADREQLPR